MQTDQAMDFFYSTAVQKNASWTGLMHRLINAIHHPSVLGRVELRLTQEREVGIHTPDHYSMKVSITHLDDDRPQWECEFPLFRFPYNTAFDLADTSIDILNEAVEYFEGKVTESKTLFSRERFS